MKRVKSRTIGFILLLSLGFTSFAQAAKIITIALDMPLGNPAKLSFKDVPKRVSSIHILIKWRPRVLQQVEQTAHME